MRAHMMDRHARWLVCQMAGVPASGRLPAPSASSEAWAPLCFGPFAFTVASQIGIADTKCLHSRCRCESRASERFMDAQLF